MTPADRQRLREALQATAPVVVRFHGAPRNAPALRPRGCGYIAFRSWGNAYIEIAPVRPLTGPEHMALLAAVQPWDLLHGMTVRAGPEGWPLVEESADGSGANPARSPRTERSIDAGGADG